MSEPETVASPSRSTPSFLPVATNLVAAFLAGSMFLTIALLLGVFQLTAIFDPGFSVDANDLDRTTVLVVALAVSVTPVRHLGWIIGAVGMAAEVFLFYNGAGTSLSAFILALSVAVGLHLGGMLAALATSDGPSRWAIAVGLGAGIVAGPYMYSSTLLTPDRPDVVSRDGLVMVAIAALVFVCGAALMLPGVRPATPGLRLSWWPPVVAVLAAAVVGRALWRVWMDFLTDRWRTADSDAERMALGTLDRVGPIVIAAIVAVLLLVVAYRRGGLSLARWVVVGFALGVTGLALPVRLDVNVLLAVMVPAAVGAVGAAAIVRWADRRVPADALGVALATVAVLLAAPTDSQPMTATAGVGALAFAYGFTLTAGLARLTNADGPGITGADVAGAAALGLAALLVTEDIVMPPGRYFVFEYANPMHLVQARTLAGAAVVLLVLFGLSVLTRRREAPADATPPGVLVS